jgi:hypothetical protein
MNRVMALPDPIRFKTRFACNASNGGLCVWNILTLRPWLCRTADKEDAHGEIRRFNEPHP